MKLKKNILIIVQMAIVHSLAKGLFIHVKKIKSYSFTFFLTLHYQYGLLQLALLLFIKHGKGG